MNDQAPEIHRGSPTPYFRLADWIMKNAGRKRTWKRRRHGMEKANSGYGQLLERGLGLEHPDVGVGLVKPIKNVVGILILA